MTNKKFYDGSWKFHETVKKYGLAPYIDRIRSVFSGFDLETNEAGESITVWMKHHELDPNPVEVTVDFENSVLTVCPWSYGEPCCPWSADIEGGTANMVAVLENLFG